MGRCGFDNPETTDETSGADPPRLEHTPIMVASRATRDVLPLSSPAKPAVLVVDIPGKGRGMVAARRIQAGELVDTAPVIVVPARDYAAVSSTILDGYVYDWGTDGAELAVALGFGSLYNHSFQPNVHYTKRADIQAIEYRALTDIPRGAELLVNYNGAVDDVTPMRFEVR